MIGVGRGWKEKISEERKDSDDFFPNPGYALAECALENFSAAVNSYYRWNGQLYPGTCDIYQLRNISTQRASQVIRVAETWL